MVTDKRIGLGLIGCGAFGRFCLETFSRMDSLRVAGVADIRQDRADQLGNDFGAAAYYNAIEMIASDEVELVHIATPPSTHYELVMAAVEHGKHCLCEKPLAVSTSEADEMLAAAAKKKLLVPVNFVLRYNTVTDAVKGVIDSGVLGDVLAAVDELRFRHPAIHGSLVLGQDVSGGIFIEHGVHFFDLYRYWLGPGEVISAHTETRDRTTQEDRVMCEVRHEGGAIASHYHGFDQVIAMDRTDHRLVCEMGDIRVNGWISLAVTVDAAVDDEGAIRLAKCLGECDVEVIERFEGKQVVTVGRGKKRTVTQRISLNYTPQPDKQAAYIASVRDLMADQIAYLRDSSHSRRVVEQNGRDALALAEAAAKMAEG